MLIWKVPAALHPTLEVAAAQSMAVGTADFNGEELPRPLADNYSGVMASARVEVRPYDDGDGGEVHLGAFGQTREVVYTTGGVDRYWAGGVDAEADLPAVGLRVWADVVTGGGHFAASTGDKHSSFLVAQAVVGWRRGGAKRGKQFIEPFVSGTYGDPSMAVDDDTVSQIVVGLGGGRWKRWRGQVQFAQQLAGTVQPANLAGFEVTVDDRQTVTAQLGAAF